MNVKASACRAEFSAMLDRVEMEQRRITIYRHTDPVAVLVSPSEVKELDELRRLYKFNAGRRTVQ